MRRRAAAHRRDHAGVALHPARLASPGRAMLATDAHGDRRRDPRAGAEQARQRTWRCRWSGCDALCGDRLTRIGLSATQKPIEEVARFLVGAGADGAPSAECTIVDIGHRRARDLALEVPPSPLEAVMSDEVWEQVYDRLAELIARAPHDAGLRQHAAHGRARRAPAVRAPRRGRRSPRTTAASPRSSGSTPSSG